MKVFVCLAAILAVAVAQKCTDQDLATKDIKPMVEKCKEKLGAAVKTLPKQKKHEEMAKCILEEQKMFKDNGEFDFDKYKKESEKYLTADMKKKILETMEKIWTEAKGNAAEFFKNLHAQLKELCPEDKYSCSGEKE